MSRYIETRIRLSTLGGCNGCTEHGPSTHYRVTAVSLLGCEFRVCDTCRDHLISLLKREGSVVLGFTRDTPKEKP